MPWGTCSRRSATCSCTPTGDGARSFSSVACPHCSPCSCARGCGSRTCGGRRTIGLALAGAVVTIPIWAFAPALPLLVGGAFIMQFFVQGAWGVIPAHLNELSPDAVRGFLPGFAYQCGVAIASQIPHVQALFAPHTSYATAMALSATTVCIPGAVCAGLGPEPRGEP